MTPTLGLVLHLVCSAYMTGIIWFVQRVQYPMFHLTDGQASSGAGHQEYTTRMGFVVMPVMLAELGLQLWLLLTGQQELALLTTGLLAVIWLSTFLLQVPCHTALNQGYDKAAHQKLVRTNWIRTLAWTARTAILIWVFF